MLPPTEELTTQKYDLREAFPSAYKYVTFLIFEKNLVRLRRYFPLQFSYLDRKERMFWDIII